MGQLPQVHLMTVLMKTLLLMKWKAIKPRGQRRKLDLLEVVNYNFRWLKVASKATLFSLKILNKETINFLQVDLNDKSVNSHHSLLLITVRVKTNPYLFKRKNLPLTNLHHSKKKALRKMRSSSTNKTQCRKSYTATKCNSFWSHLLGIMRLTTKKS